VDLEEGQAKGVMLVGHPYQEEEAIPEVGIPEWGQVEDLDLEAGEVEDLDEEVKKLAVLDLEVEALSLEEQVEEEEETLDLREEEGVVVLNLEVKECRA